MTQDNEQSAENITVTGTFKQSSDVAHTKQKAKTVSGSSFHQNIFSQKTNLQLGNFSAVGVIGVIALVVVAFGWFILSFLTQ